MKSRSMSAFLLPTIDSYHKYFSDEVCDSLELIEADYGLKGFAVVIKLWQKIQGGNEGYYCLWNDRVGTLFAKKIGAGKGLVFDIVNRMVKEGIFDKGLFERYGILTSEWLQQNWLAYMKRRADAKIEDDYLLVRCAQKSENASENAEIADKNEETADKNNTTILDKTLQDLTLSYQTEDNASLLTAKQREELVSMSSILSVEKYELKLFEWQKENGKKCRDPFKTIKGWIEEDLSRRKKPSKEREKEKPSYDLDEYERLARSFDFEKAMKNGGDDG